MARRIGLKELLKQYGVGDPPAVAGVFDPTFGLSTIGGAPTFPPPEGKGSAARVGGVSSMAAIYARALVEAQLKARARRLAQSQPRLPAPEPRPSLVGMIGHSPKIYS